MYTKYLGIILKKYPLGEADELLTIYTGQEGKLRVLAKGVRKIQSKLAGALQSLNEVEFETATPADAKQTAALPVLVSVRVNTINGYLREDLKKFAYALVGIETLYRLTGDREPNSEIYQHLKKFLEELGPQSGRENLLVRMFQLKLLAASGYEFPNPLPDELTPEAEQEIDKFLNYVLEREIKSKGFLRTLNQEL